MTITFWDGRALRGTVLQIVKQMKSLALLGSEVTLAQYVEHVVERAQEFEGKWLRVSGETDEELATSLVQALVESGLARRQTLS
jgi:hypothetical protein